MSRKQFCLAVLICAGLLTGLALAQTNTKPLTNDDVIAMVKGGLPETTVINAINAQESNFDVSATALIKLKQQGVNSKIMDAMLAAANKKHSAAAAPASTPAPAPVAAGQPSVLPRLQPLLLQPRLRLLVNLPLRCLRVRHSSLFLFPKRRLPKPRPRPHL